MPPDHVLFNKTVLLPKITSSFDPLDWFPEECDWSGLDEAPSCMRVYHRAALGNIYGDSQFAQPPLRVVEVGLQVADELRRLAGRGYDCRVIRVKG